MIGKILLADSGTGHTEEMLKSLMEIPSVQAASVTVLHVVPPQVTAEDMVAKWEEGGRILSQAIQNLKLDPARVTAVLREGEPKDVVLKVADEVDADLIIMGSRGLKRIQSILENSVSQYVFQLASRPMLLVRDDLYVKKINKKDPILDEVLFFDEQEVGGRKLVENLMLVKDLLKSSVPPLYRAWRREAVGEVVLKQGKFTEDFIELARSYNLPKQP